MLDFSKTFKALRKKRGLTQKELAEILNVSQNAIYNWENGKREPSLKMIENIANALNVSIETLIGLDMLGKKFLSESNSKTKAIDGIIFILEYIYGSVTKKTISDLVYYLIETDTESFVLTPEDINKLLNYSKVSFPLLVNELKDTRKEKDIQDEIIKSLKIIQ